MSSFLAVLVTIGSLLLAIPTWLLIRYAYYRPSSDWQTLACAWTGLVIALTPSVLLYPLDIWLISTQIINPQTGQLTQWALDEYFPRTRPLLKQSYQIGYGLLTAWVLVVLPLSFSWYTTLRRDGEGELALIQLPSSTSKNSKNRYRRMLNRFLVTLKYSAVFIVVFGTLLVSGIVWKPNQPQSTLAQLFQRTIGWSLADDSLAFAVGMLMLAGMLLVYLPYTSYGMAEMPIQLIKRPVDSRLLLNTDTESSTGSVTPRHSPGTQLRACQRKLRSIFTKYPAGTAPTSMSRNDQKLILQLERDEQQLMRRIVDEERRQSHWWYRWWPRIKRSLELLIGMLFLGVSILLLVAIVLANIERLLQTFCDDQRCRTNGNASSGSSVSAEWLMRPLDYLLMSKLSDRLAGISIDYSVISGIIIYVFACTVKSISSIGIRLLFCLKLSGVGKHRTKPRALIMMTGLLMLLLLTIQSTMVTVAPKYTAFGSQMFCNLTGTGDTHLIARHCVADSPFVQPCHSLWTGLKRGRSIINETTNNSTTTTTCTQSVFTGIFHTISGQHPYVFQFGFYLAQWLFVAFMIIGMVAAALKPRELSVNSSSSQQQPLPAGHGDDQSESDDDNINNDSDRIARWPPANDESNRLIEAAFGERLRRGSQMLTSAFSTVSTKTLATDKPSMITDDEVASAQTDLLSPVNDDYLTDSTPLLRGNVDGQQRRCSTKSNNWWSRLLSH